MNLLPQMSGSFDIVLKQLMLAKKDMGSAVKTDSNNPFHKSRYASLGAHLDLCESNLDKHGLIMMQTVSGSNVEPVLIATLCHPESGQWIRSYMPLPNPKGDSQGLGASITYMRRYSINSMLGLQIEDDDGESSCVRQKQEPAKTNVPQKLTAPQVQLLKMLDSQLSPESKSKLNTWLQNTYKTMVLSELPSQCYNVVHGAFDRASKLMSQPKMELAHA